MSECLNAKLRNKEVWYAEERDVEDEEQRMNTQERNKNTVFKMGGLTGWRGGFEKGWYVSN